jgi:SnoaL-like polyketide cyclase
MDPKELAQMLFDDINNRTYKQNAAKIVAPDAVLSDSNTGQELRGPEGAIAYNEQWINAFPDAKVTVKNHEVMGNTVKTTFMGSGHFTGMMPAPDGSMVQGQGQALNLEFVQESEFKDGMLVRLTNSYDMNAMMQQLGMA